MHLTLYRKFRPDDFSKVIGQDHIVTTLRNEVKNSSVSHSYLFTGSRGTGKTTCARIFSKAVNCLNPVNGSPCGKCKVCVSLSEPNNTDIIEIDAASNNRVDEIRDLREKVKFPPIIGKYKVYIIDEVHMLTDSAFNALLKTLEEPPAHAIFILATTEVYKLPATILSRCKRFDFKLIDTQDLVKLLDNVFKKSNITCDEESKIIIANAGQGSARDTLSIADSVASYCNNNITIEKTKEVLSYGNLNIISEIVYSISINDAKQIYYLIETALKNNISINVMCKEMCEFLKNLMLINSGVSFSNLNLLKSDFIYFDKLKNLERSWISKAFEKFAKIELDLKYSINPVNLFYSICLSLIDFDGNFKQILKTNSNTNDNEKKLKNDENIQNNDKKIDKNDEKIENIEKNIENLSNIITNQTEDKEIPSDVDAGKLFGNVLIEAKNKNLYALYTALKSVYNVSIENKVLKLNINDKTAYSLLDDQSRIDVLLNIVKSFDESIENVKIEFDTSTKSEKDTISCLKNLFGNKIKIKE